MAKNQGKYKIINNRLFNKLWTSAGKINNKNQYIQMYTSVTSENYINFNKKYGLKYEEAIELLNEIYIKQNLSFKEILELANKRKADISNTFCIPIRTVEEWYSGKNNCAGYIKLMILKQYKLLNLGKYIHLEAEVEYKNNSIPVYKKREIKDTNYRDEPQKENRVEVSTSNEDDELSDIDNFLKELEERRKNRISLPENTDVKTLLEKTEFIGKIISRK